MKTKELIRILQNEDPDGECEVVVDGRDIYYVEKNPFYYDGLPTLLIRDKNKSPYYDVVGIRIPGNGYKISLKCLDAEDVIWDNPDCIIEYESEYGKAKYYNFIEKTKEKVKKFKQGMVREKLLKKISRYLKEKIKNAWKKSSV